MDAVDRASLHLDIYERTRIRPLRPAKTRRRQDWRRCRACGHQQTAHRYGIFLGSCASCTCPAWRPTNPYTLSLAIARRLTGRSYR